MFENVPKRLTDYLRGAASDFDRESFYYFAAAFLGVFYLKKNFMDLETSAFLDIQRTSRGGIWYGHVGRVPTLFPRGRRFVLRDYSRRSSARGSGGSRCQDASRSNPTSADCQALKPGSVINADVKSSRSGNPFTGEVDLTTTFTNGESGYCASALRRCRARSSGREVSVHCRPIRPLTVAR